MTAISKGAELGFYPFEDIRWAWKELWNLVHAQAG
ncbi:MAG: hypothetical protein RLZZ51_477, partial [Actinomycetota bacterium]